MKIGELARSTGVHPRMLRYYEERGLLEPSRDPNGYRSYGAHQVERVKKIRDLLELAFYLAQLGMPGETLFGALAMMTCLIALGADVSTKADISVEEILRSSDAGECRHKMLSPLELIKAIPGGVIEACLHRVLLGAGPAMKVSSASVNIDGIYGCHSPPWRLRWSIPVAMPLPSIPLPRVAPALLCMIVPEDILHFGLSSYWLVSRSRFSLMDALSFFVKNA